MSPLTSPGTPMYKRINDFDLTYEELCPGDLSYDPTFDGVFFMIVSNVVAFDEIDNTTYTYNQIRYVRISCRTDQVTIGITSGYPDDTWIDPDTSEIIISRC